MDDEPGLVDGATPADGAWILSGERSSSAVSFRVGKGPHGRSHERAGQRGCVESPWVHQESAAHGLKSLLVPEFGAIPSRDGRAPRRN